jgi:hypothetical protein
MKTTKMAWTVRRTTFTCGSSRRFTSVLSTHRSFAAAMSATYLARQVDRANDTGFQGSHIEVVRVEVAS